MRFTRREFIKLFSSSAAALGITNFFVPEIAQALESLAGNPPAALWLQGSGCSGCAASLLNATHPKISEIIFKIINLQYHPLLMAGSGELAFRQLDKVKQANKGKYILVLEGAVPTAENGIFCTIAQKNGKTVTLFEEIKNLSQDAAVLVAVGTCAAFGGISASGPNPAQCRSFSQITSRQVINIPGCPPHPDWIVGTLVHLILFGMPELDGLNRPVLFYGKNIHEKCQNYSYFIQGRFAKKLSDDFCLYKLGCRGPLTFADCPTRRWNGAVNWCISAQAPCIGCCNERFPDATKSFYTKLPAEILAQEVEYA